MTLDLREVPRLVSARTVQWESAGVAWGELHASPDDGSPKAVVWQAFAGAGWEGDIMVWDSGEVELAAMKQGGWHLAKHYDLEAPEDIDLVLDDVASLIESDTIPLGARDWHTDGVSG